MASLTAADARRAARAGFTRLRRPSRPDRAEVLAAGPVVDRTEGPAASADAAALPEAGAEWPGRLRCLPVAHLEVAGESHGLPDGLGPPGGPAPVIARHAAATASDRAQLRRAGLDQHIAGR